MRSRPPVAGFWHMHITEKFLKNLNVKHWILVHFHAENDNILHWVPNYNIKNRRFMHKKVMGQKPLLDPSVGKVGVN